MSSRVDIRELYACGRRAWPDLDLAFDVFEAHAARVLDLEAGDLAREHAADLYLCCACVARHPSAMGLLERKAASTVESAIARLDRDRDFVQETLQEFWEKVLGGSTPKISEYAARGPLDAWLRVTAVRQALDNIRAQKIHAGRRQSLDEALAAESLGAEATLIRQRYAPAFQRALVRAIAALPPRDRNVLRMHVQGRCTIDDIARVYNRHRATAARWLERARGRVFDLLHAELSGEHAGLTPAELRSIARVLGSALFLTLSESQPATHEDGA